MNDDGKKKNGNNKKRKVRALMAEMGTNYTTALRAYDAAVARRYAEQDAAAAGFSGPSVQGQPAESATPAAVGSALNLQFSDSRAPDPEADDSE